MSRPLSRLGLLLLPLAGAGAFLLHARADEGGAGPGRAPVPVTVAVAARQDLPLRLDTVGRVQASESVTLRSRVDGQVAQVLFPEGRPVRRGDVLLRLDDGDFRARLAQAQAALARDQAQLDNARAELARNEQLKEKNYVSDDQLKTARSTADALAATVAGDRAAVASAQLQLDYTVIRAPFDGRMGARLVYPGTTVKTSDTALAVINRVHPVQVAFAIPEKYLGQLAPLRHGGRMTVVVTAPGDAALHVTGQADFVDNAVDPATGTIQARASFANTDDRLVPGALVTISLQLAVLHGVITVPEQAVQQNGDDSSVFVVAAGKAQPRHVQVGEQRDGVAVISAGLQAGEAVVTDGQLRLTPGAAVKAVSGKPAQ